jgi:hypothetical protein
LFSCYRQNRWAWGGGSLLPKCFTDAIQTTQLPTTISPRFSEVSDVTQGYGTIILRVEWGDRELLATTKIFKLDNENLLPEDGYRESCSNWRNVSKYSTISKMYRKWKWKTEKHKLKELNKKRQKEMNK